MKKLMILPMCLLAGCATITRGTNQKITVNTEPKTKLSCLVKNARGQWRVDAPGEVAVHKDSGALNFTCRTKANKKVRYDELAQLDPMVFGNIIFGGIIGAAIDGIDGASHRYNDSITIPLNADASVKLAKLDKEKVAKKVKRRGAGRHA